MRKISRKQAKELVALARMPDEQIDLSDAPEVRDWRSAVVGKFYRPIKTPVTIRVDADVLAWLKRQGRGYQTRINKLLRGSHGSKARPKGLNKSRASAWNGVFPVAVVLSLSRHRQPLPDVIETAHTVPVSV
jgi:uncharacterized protein (DUF4415 family)